MGRFQYKLICMDSGHEILVGDMKCPKHGVGYKLTVPTQKQKKWWQIWK